MRFAFFNLFRNLRKFRVISKNKMKLSNLKTGLLLELKIAPDLLFIFVLQVYTVVSVLDCLEAYSAENTSSVS